MRTMIMFSGVAFFFLTGYTPGDNKVKSADETNDTSSAYYDGTFEGVAQGPYTSEVYWGHATVTIEGGAFTTVLFEIIDSNTLEHVDSMYGIIHFAGNEHYQQQCVEDGHGIEIYPQRLLERQNLDSIDCITGATWSWRIFRSCVNLAIISHRKPALGVHTDQNDAISLTTAPNPFIQDLSLEYYLPEAGNISIGMYNQEGKMIRELVSGIQQPGSYTIEWQNDLPEGTYFIMLKAGNYVQCNKIVKVAD